MSCSRFWSHVNTSHALISGHMMIYVLYWHHVYRSHDASKAHISTCDRKWEHGIYHNVIRNESMSYINTKSEMIGMLQVVNPLWNCCGLVLFISHLLFLRCRENALGNGFYAPNFKDVKGAYWLGPVRLFVRLSVRPSVVHYALCWLYHYRAAWATNLKFYLQHEYKK